MSGLLFQEESKSERTLWFNLCGHLVSICSEYNESRISSGLFRFASIFRADYFHYHRSISLLFFLIKLQIWVFLSTVQPLSHHPKWLMMHLTGELAAEWRERKWKRGERERERWALTQRHTSMKMECLRKTKEQIRGREGGSECCWVNENASDNETFLLPTSLVCVQYHDDTPVFPRPPLSVHLNPG